MLSRLQQLHMPVCVLLCFIKSILWIRYGLGVSSCQQASDNLGWPVPQPAPVMVWLWHSRFAIIFFRWPKMSFCHTSPIFKALSVKWTFENNIFNICDHFFALTQVSLFTIDQFLWQISTPPKNRLVNSGRFDRRSSVFESQNTPSESRCRRRHHKMWPTVSCTQN